MRGLATAPRWSAGAASGLRGATDGSAHFSVDQGTGVLHDDFVLQKRFNLGQSPEIDFEIEAHSDEFLTHSCSNYTDDGSTVFTRDGKLVLKVASHCEGGGCMNSGRMMSRDGFKYGLFTFSAKVPKCDHIWPAIWFLPVDQNGNGTYGTWPRSGEMDLLETVHDGGFGTFNLVAGYGTREPGCTPQATVDCNTSQRDNYCTSTTMNPTSFKGLNPYYVQEKVNCAAGEKSWEEHVFVMNWQPDEVTAWVDPVFEWDANDTLRRVTPKEAPPEAKDVPTWLTFRRPSTPTWAAVEGYMDKCFPNEASLDAPFDIEFKIVLNIAVGGYGGAPCTWGQDSCQTICGGAVGSELIVSDISVWQKSE